MKQLKTLLLATALCVGTVSFTNAQSKIAHINTQELITAMPAMSTAQKELEAKSNSLKADLKAMATEFQNKAKQYEDEASTKTEKENSDRGLELQKMQGNIQQFQADAQKDLQTKEMELLQPITEKAKASILKVARAQGFDYVLDSSQGVTILTDGKNLLDDVKKDLGM